MTKILVLAPESLTGSRFVESLSQKFEISGAGIRSELTDGLNLASFNDLDITKLDQVSEVFNSYSGQIIINFVGATDVGAIEKTRPQDVKDQGELNNNLAYRINVLGTKNIISACIKTAKLPIFISSDFVFNGNSGPYSEDDEMARSPDEISWYGWTKLLADQKIASSDLKSLTLRISYPYRKEFIAKGDFARNFLSLYGKFVTGEIDAIYPVFTDQLFSPTFIDDISKAVMCLLEKEERGLFNLASLEQTNFYNFFCRLLIVARGVNNPEKIIPRGSIIDYQKNNPDKPKWPINGGLRSDKISKLGFRPTSWQDGIIKAFEKNA